METVSTVCVSQLNLSSPALGVVTGSSKAGGGSEGEEAAAGAAGSARVVAGSARGVPGSAGMAQGWLFPHMEEEKICEEAERREKSQEGEMLEVKEGQKEEELIKRRGLKL